MARRFSVPAGLLGMVAMVVAVEAGLGSRDRFTTDHALDWKLKGEYAQRAAGGVLCFGDSLVEYGVLPNILHERLGGQSYNFALPGGTPAVSHDLLKRCLDSGARPRAVVVDFPPWQLVPVSHLEEARRRLWPMVLEPSEVLDLALSRRDPGLAATIWVSQALASYRDRFEIRASILAALDGKDRRDNDIRNFLTRWNLRSNRGAIVMPDQGRRADPLPGLPAIKDRRRDPTFVADVDRFLRLAASRSIPVYGLAMPFSPEHQADCDAAGGTAAYDAFLRDEQAKFPGLIVVDARHLGYDPSLFNDAMHLNRRGATALSDDLAALIAEGPGPGRWVALPPYRERPASPRVEDIMESRVAIGLDPPRGRLR